MRPEHTLSSDGIDIRLMLIRPPVVVLAHYSPGCSTLQLLHAAMAGGLHWQPTSVSAPSSRAAARMSAGTDLGHRRRPAGGPWQARAAPVTPILLGFGRGTPGFHHGFHPEGCAGFNSRSSELKPAQPWELKPAAGIRTSTGTDADDGTDFRPSINGIGGACASRHTVCESSRERWRDRAGCCRTL